jgi:hypothetical protein
VEFLENCRSRKFFLATIFSGKISVLISTTKIGWATYIHSVFSKTRLVTLAANCGPSSPERKTRNSGQTIPKPEEK